MNYDIDLWRRIWLKNRATPGNNESGRFSSKQKFQYPPLQSLG
jgi:hypothetical protein